MTSLSPDSTIRSDPKLVSVIIPTLNAESTIGEQLEALAGQSYAGKWELLVVDNGSTDNTREIVRRYSQRVPVRIIDAFKRKGINYARNAGAAAAAGDLLLYCDADDVVSTQWMEAMASASRSYDLLGGALDHTSLNKLPQSHWRKSIASTYLPIVFGFLPFAVGANCGVWAAVFREIGGWNEDYVGGSDDVELSWRAQLNSFSLGFVPEAVIYYRHRENLKGLARQYFAYGRQQVQLYHDYRKHGIRRRRLRGALKSWAWLIIHTPDLLSPDKRTRWVQKASFRYGMLRGSMRHRVIFL